MTAATGEPAEWGRRARVQPLGPESRDKEARMRVMLDAAVALFAEEGYAAVSTRRIAEVAGCSETLLFRYFGGKRGLLLAICNDLIEVPVRRPKPSDFDSLREFLEQHCLWLFETFKKSGARLKIVTAGIVSDSELSAEFEKRHDDEVAYVTQELAYFQERGEIAPDVDLHAIAVVMEQATFSIGLLMQIVYAKPQAELEAVAKAFARALTSGLRGDGETAAVPEPWRRDVLHAARSATQELDKIVGLLEAAEPNGDNGPRKKARSKRVTGE